MLPDYLLLGYCLTCCCLTEHCLVLPVIGLVGWIWCRLLLSKVWLPYNVLPGLCLPGFCPWKGQSQRNDLHVSLHKLNLCWNVWHTDEMDLPFDIKSRQVCLSKNTSELGIKSSPSAVLLKVFSSSKWICEGRELRFVIYECHDWWGAFNTWSRWAPNTQEISGESPRLQTQKTTLEIYMI